MAKQKAEPTNSKEAEKSNSTQILRFNGEFPIPDKTSQRPLTSITFPLSEKKRLELRSLLEKTKITFKEEQNKELINSCDFILESIDDTYSNFPRYADSIQILLQRIVNDKIRMTEQEEKIKHREEIIIEQNNVLKAREKVVAELEEKARLNVKIAREEESELRGHSKIEKVQTLLLMVKDAICVENQTERDLIARGVDISQEKDYLKQIVRATGDYVFRVDDAKKAQTNIIRILKYLNLLIESRSLSYSDRRKYDGAVGLLTMLHFKLDFIGNQIDTMAYRPLELRRLFSALEPAIVGLSYLDDEEKETDSMDKSIMSFKSFKKEEQERFISTIFIPEFVTQMKVPIQEESLAKLLSMRILYPELVLAQMKKWDEVNTNKFLDYLRVYLTSAQRLNIAQEDINELKKLWMRGGIMKSE